MLVCACVCVTMCVCPGVLSQYTWAGCSSCEHACVGNCSLIFKLFFQGPILNTPRSLSHFFCLYFCESFYSSLSSSGVVVRVLATSRQELQEEAMEVLI